MSLSSLLAAGFGCYSVNATMRARSETLSLDLATVQQLLDVNTLAAFRLTQLAVPGMLAKGGGAIVNVTSIAGPLAGGADAGYTLAKGALDALAYVKALEQTREKPLTKDVIAIDLRIKGRPTLRLGPDALQSLHDGRNAKAAKGEDA